MIAILIIRCRFVRNGVDVQEDAVVEWVKLKAFPKKFALLFRKVIS